MIGKTVIYNYFYPLILDSAFRSDLIGSKIVRKVK